MSLPKKPLPAETVDPAMIIIYGSPKIGKTHLLATLPGCLIIDTEKGSKRIEALKVEIDSRDDLKDLIGELKSAKDRYKYIAIDTFDNIVLWIEEHVCAVAGVTAIGDIAYGAGYQQVRVMSMVVIKELKKLTDHLIIVSHLKKSLIGGENDTVEAKGIDITGKLKNILMADADSIGIIYREDDKLHISFVTDENVEAGSRDPHLAGKEFEFDWKKIYQKLK